jgi:XTP/dITP diphosphohydrolase
VSKMAGLPLFVTRNVHKVREAREILHWPIEQGEYTLLEIQSITLEPVIRHKLSEAYQHFQRPIIVEDTGLFITAWGGLPGALVHWFLKGLGNTGLCRLLQHETQRQALACSVVGFYDGHTSVIVRGEVQGEIAEQPRGMQGFGWDPIFIPQGAERTFGEMTATEKHGFSMRRKALENLRATVDWSQGN